MTTEELLAVPWRAGRSQPRNIYARTGGDDWRADLLIGHMDTPALAAEAIECHNARVAAMRAGQAAAEQRTRLSNVTGVQFGHGNTQTNVF